MLGSVDLLNILRMHKIRHGVIQYLQHRGEILQSLNQLLVGSQLLCSEGLLLKLVQLARASGDTSIPKIAKEDLVLRRLRELLEERE